MCLHVDWKIKSKILFTYIPIYFTSKKRFLRFFWNFFIRAISKKKNYSTIVCGILLLRKLFKYKYLTCKTKFRHV